MSISRISTPFVPQTLPPTQVKEAARQQALHRLAQPDRGTVGNGTSQQQVNRFTAALLQNGRSLSDRDVLASLNALQSRAAQHFEKSQALRGAWDHGVENAVRTLRKRMQQRQLRNHREAMEELLKELGGDSAKAHAVLKAAARQASKDGEDGEHVHFAEQLKALRQKMRSKYGKAALPSFGNTRAASRTPLNPRRRDRLRNIYEAALNGQPNVVGLIEALLSDQEDQSEFDLSLKDMRFALADDLASLKPSTSQQQLRTLMHGLNTARHVSTLLGGCKHLLGRMRGKNPSLQAEAPAFLKHLLSLIAKGMAINETLQLAQYIGGKQLKHQLAFLNGLRPMLQQLPVLLWRDLKSRQNALGNLLTLMAELTRQEQNQLMEVQA